MRRSKRGSTGPSQGQHAPGPVGRGARFAKLARMTASVAGTYARTRLTTAFQRHEAASEAMQLAHRLSGERIARTLGELKGAAMKIGQMASAANDILPKELLAALLPLQNDAPPMPYEVIAQQIEAELGAAPERLFSHFSHEPFAAASIGQVHRARTDDGREVVCKIQYPGVDTSVDSDLAQIKLALRSGGLVRFGRKHLDGVFAEIRDRLVEELDYCREADNVRLFARAHGDDPWLKIPEVVGERSSKRILTLTHLAGDSMHDLHRAGYTQEERDRIALHIFRMLCKQIFRSGLLHADPNPANFAFRRDGSVILYDFGCIKRLSSRVVQAYHRTLRDALAEDYEGVDQGLLALGARNPAGPPVEPSYYKRWRDVLLRPLIGPDPFDYGKSTLHEEVIELLPGLLRRLKSFQPPIDLVFVDRVVAGHYSNLRRICPHSRFHDEIPRYLEGPPPQPTYGAS